MSKKIRFVLPWLAISGCGHVLLRYADWLLGAGNDVKIINMGENTIARWYVCSTPIINKVDLVEEDITDIDILVATNWSTISYVTKIQAKRKINYIQTDERRFHHDPRVIRAINYAYNQDLEVVVSAHWIEKLWLTAYDKIATYIPNSLDPGVFFKSEPFYKKQDKIRVLLEGNIQMPSKGMIESYSAISGLNCEIWVASSYGDAPHYWKVDKFFKAVPFKDLQKIYSSCDILLKMSKIEGCYLPPMEAMACGCAVVTGRVTGYDEYIVGGYNALVVNQGDILGATKAVQSLIDNKALRETLIENGLKTVKEWPVENSRKAVLQYFT